MHNSVAKLARTLYSGWRKLNYSILFCSILLYVNVRLWWFRRWEAAASWATSPPWRWPLVRRLRRPDRRSLRPPVRCTSVAKAIGGDGGGRLCSLRRWRMRRTWPTSRWWTSEHRWFVQRWPSGAAARRPLAATKRAVVEERLCWEMRGN